MAHVKVLNATVVEMIPMEKVMETEAKSATSAHLIRTIQKHRRVRSSSSTCGATPHGEEQHGRLDGTIGYLRERA